MAIVSYSMGVEATAPRTTEASAATTRSDDAPEIACCAPEVDDMTGCDCRTTITAAATTTTTLRLSSSRRSITTTTRCNGDGDAVVAATSPEVTCAPEVVVCVPEVYDVDACGCTTNTTTRILLSSKSRSTRRLALITCAVMVIATFSMTLQSGRNITTTTFLLRLPSTKTTKSLTFDASASAAVSSPARSSSLSSLSSSSSASPTTTRATGENNNNNNNVHQKKTNVNDQSAAVIVDQRSNKNSSTDGQQQQLQQQQIQRIDQVQFPMIMNTTDIIYRHPTTILSWSRSPIVIERYRLIFFAIPKVACTTFKQLFRRIEGYSKDWNIQTTDIRLLPHNPDYNRLKYLKDYNIEEANQMMQDTTWTKAIFVRDPKHRVLSAFLDKGYNHPTFMINQCCNSKRDTMTGTGNDDDNSACWPSSIDQGQQQRTFTKFLNLIKTCDNEHWELQSNRIDTKYFPYINFVGHFETKYEDTKRLLEKLGAWDEYGMTGYGKDGNLAIFEEPTTTATSSSSTSSSSNTNLHATGSTSKYNEWYNTDLERIVEEHYSADYKNPIFGL